MAIQDFEDYKCFFMNIDCFVIQTENKILADDLNLVTHSDTDFVKKKYINKDMNLIF